MQELEELNKNAQDVQGEEPAVGQETEDEAQVLRAELEAERKMRQKSESELLCRRLLQEGSLPAELCDYLTCDSVEETQKTVKEVSRIIKRAINDAVKSRLTTVNTPNQGRTAMTRAEFKSLSLSERQKLYLSDKELYRELSKNN